MTDDLIQPSAGEAANGWTAESLTAYIREREQAQDGIVANDPFYRPAERPQVANGRYSPFRWRR